MLVSGSCFSNEIAMNKPDNYSVDYLYERALHNRGIAGHVADMLGMTLSSVTRIGDEAIIFEADGGRHTWVMCHIQDCCERVEIIDVDADLQLLVGNELIRSGEEMSLNVPPLTGDGWGDSYTWTFYRLATIRGGVNIRWFGSSNGYYSEKVDFVKVRSNGAPVNI